MHPNGAPCAWESQRRPALRAAVAMIERNFVWKSRYAIKAREARAEKRRKGERARLGRKGEKAGKMWSRRTGGGSEGTAELIIIRHYPVSANHCNPYFIFCRFFVAGQGAITGSEITGVARPTTVTDSFPRCSRDTTRRVHPLRTQRPLPPPPFIRNPVDHRANEETREDAFLVNFEISLFDAKSQEGEKGQSRPEDSMLTKFLFLQRTPRLRTVFNADKQSRRIIIHHERKKGKDISIWWIFDAQIHRSTSKKKGHP